MESTTCDYCEKTFEKEDGDSDAELRRRLNVHVSRSSDHGGKNQYPDDYNPVTAERESSYSSSDESDREYAFIYRDNGVHVDIRAETLDKLQERRNVVKVLLDG